MVNVVPCQIVSPFVGQVISAVKELGTVLTIMTDADAVALFPAASRAMALTVWLPSGKFFVFHAKLYGIDVEVDWNALST
jgi:hypothetical protein